jgi:HEAT repeat protein
VLVDVSHRALDHAERYAMVVACKKLQDDRLVPSLAGLLASNEPDVRQGTVEALLKIDTTAAAQALQPHLAEEANLATKLEIAEFLGRHGILDGYPYAIEHMSEPYLRERAVAALAAIRDPRAAGELRKILDTSNDVEWNSAAIEALGRLGATDLAPRFLEMAGNTKSPLVPAALVALGDLHQAEALPLVRTGLSSRRPEVLTASARAAGQLAALPGVNAGDVRDQLAALLADPAASLEARSAALDSLLLLKDPRLDTALAQAVRDAGLERDPDALLNRIEKLLADRKVSLAR